MRRNLLVAILVGGGLSLCMWGVSAAQGQAGRPVSQVGADVRVALVDVAYVFKKYDKFNRLYEEMKKEVKKREDEITDAQNELKSLFNKKQQFTPDSPDYKRIDQQLAQKKAELELLAQNSKQEFTQKEAKLYHQTYQEVEAAIREYAERNGLTLVLRASRDDDSNANNPQDVIKEVSQQVIYALPQMDITDAILSKLNGSGAKKPLISDDKGQPKQPTKSDQQPSRTTNPQGGTKPTGGTIKK